MVHRLGFFDPGYSLDKARCAGAGPGCGSQSSVQVHGNTIETPRYRIELSNNKDDHAVTIIDKLTGNHKKAYVGGDPHVSTSDGDWTTFQHGNVTLNLDDGTKLTFDPTDNPTGPTFLKHVTITNGNDAAVVDFGANGNPAVQARPGEGHRLDRRTPDGLELRTGHGSLDDLKVVGGPEIAGHNIENLDNYRGEQNALNRPHIGLPGWRHDGPHEPWPNSARYDHHHHHHDHHHHHGDRGPRAAEIRDLQAQLRYYRHIGAEHRALEIERRLSTLEA